MGNADRRKFTSPLLNMDIRPTWITLALAVLALATTTASSSEARVVCYYTNWSVYRPGTARFNPQNINPYLCTHLIYAFGGFTKENTLKPFDKYQDIEKGGYAKFTGLKTYNKNLKTMLAIGGWNEGSARFSPMVASRERRKEFVRNAIKFLRQNRFDGLDLDWEYPAFRDGGKPKDRENYAKLVKELREEFDRESEKTGRPRLLLTMAVPAGIEYIQKGFDVKTLNQYLDWMNLLTYDYHSAFEPAVNHHAPLYPLEEPNEYSVDNELNIDYTIKFYLENGADRDKLVLGIPTYGRSYTLFNPDATEIGAPADGPGEQGDATREKGYLAYYEICEALKPKQPKKRSTSDEDDDSEEEEEDLPWTIVQPNPSAMGPVAYKGNQWVGYDDMDIVKRKAEYVAEMGLGGIMFWSIDNDDFRGTCHGKPYPLIESAKEAYINKIGSTDNAIVTESSKSVAASSRRRSRPRASTTTRPTTTKATSKARVSTTTPAWSASTPEPPTTPDPGSDFKCKDEGFFPHPRDCKKYFWCLDSGPSQLGIVAHQFTCPSGLFFNKAADSCDFARNVLCKKPASTTKAPKIKESTTPSTTTTSTTTSTTTRRPVKLVTKNTALFRTTTTTTTTTTPEPEEEIEYEDEEEEGASDVEAEDPKVIKELIDLIKKVGGVEQLEKQLHLAESGAASTSTVSGGGGSTTPATFNKKLYQKVLERTRGSNKFSGNSINEPASQNSGVQNSRRGPQSAGLQREDSDQKYLRKDRPQYTTINRLRTQSTTEEPQESEEDIEIPSQSLSRSRAVADPKEPTIVREVAGDSVREIVGSTGRPLQYVNIRRARPTTIATSDTADDTASRNALFERSEPVSLPESVSVIGADLISSRKETPEYVTIRRQRPSTEEPTTAQVQYDAEDEESLESVEKEVTSPLSQPQYKSIVRARSTTQAPFEEPSSPEPTTVLAVQISSILNSPLPEASTQPEPIPTETEAPTTTTTTTTEAPSSAAPTTTNRRIPTRRRGTTTAAPTVSSTTQRSLGSNVRKNFVRRPRPTPAAAAAVPEPANSTTTSKPSTDTTTSRYTRRGVSKFKIPTKKDVKAAAEKKEENTTNGGKSDNATTPSLSGPRVRSEPKRVFVRRRNFGGANATTTSTTAAPSSPPPKSLPTPAVKPRPFRVASRRRPLTTPTPTTAPASEEDLQDLEEPESVEEPTPRVVQGKKQVKIQKRPLTTLKEIDQNPSATNEERKGRPVEVSKEEGKRQSKKYSSNFKQNQLNEVLRQKSQSQEEVDTTDGTITTVEDFDPEAALALAAHQLISAPFPSVPDYDESKQTKKTTKSYSETTYANTQTTAKSPYTSTPIYTTLSNQYGSTSPGYRNAEVTFSSTVRKPSGFTTKVAVLNNGYSVTETYVPSTPRYVGNSEKYVSVPIEDFGYSTDSYVGGISQEPAYFTREYLLESPVTKTYDDEYQYLSPVTTPQTTTRKLPKKTVYRRISTTIRPTAAPAAPAVTTPRPRRVQQKPFEKVTKAPNRTYRPIDNYDYYDDSEEKLAGKLAEGTKVVVHGKGTIQCFDIGNFPHPTSCKKFISCARMEGGSIIGWEYICPTGLSFDPVGGICNWSAGLGCDERNL